MKRVAAFLIESGMLVLNPSIEHTDLILRAMKSGYGIDSITHPLFHQFLTFRSGSSNKFHLFVVFKNEDEYIGANAYGRIGYSPNVITIAEGKNMQEVINAVKKKALGKINKGYVIS